MPVKGLTVNCINRPVTGVLLPAPFVEPPPEPFEPDVPLPDIPPETPAGTLPPPVRTLALTRAVKVNKTVFGLLNRISLLLLSAFGAS